MHPNQGIDWNKVLDTVGAGIDKATIAIGKAKRAYDGLSDGQKQTLKITLSVASAFIWPARTVVARLGVANAVWAVVSKI